MQKRFLTLAFIGLLSTSTFAANDLLSQATDGAVVKTTEAKALSNDEMKEVKVLVGKPQYMRQHSKPI